MKNIAGETVSQRALRSHSKEAGWRSVYMWLWWRSMCNQWALGTITTNKAGGGDGIPAELFQILKDDAVKVLRSICQQIWKTQQWPQDWKRSVFIPVPKKGNAKECSNYCTNLLISHTSKVLLKFSKPSFNSTWTMNFQIVKLDLEKAEEPEIKLPISAGP